jgi:hypothetical protein
MFKQPNLSERPSWAIRCDSMNHAPTMLQVLTVIKKMRAEMSAE